jgi:hypothetical protein
MKIAGCVNLIPVKPGTFFSFLILWQQMPDPLFTYHETLFLQPAQQTRNINV